MRRSKLWSWAGRLASLLEGRAGRAWGRCLLRCTWPLQGLLQQGRVSWIQCHMVVSRAQISD